MKRIKAACLEQTVYFSPKDTGEGPEAAKRAVVSELAHYKALMDKRRIKYRILEETTAGDGTIVLRLKRQYNDYPTGDYLD